MVIIKSAWPCSPHQDPLSPTFYRWRKQYGGLGVSELRELRQLLDMLLSNCCLKGGRVECELKEPFATLSDGAEEEEWMIAAKAPKTTIN